MKDALSVLKPSCLEFPHGTVYGYVDDTVHLCVACFTGVFAI